MMRPVVKQSLVIGALVGFFLGAFFYHESQNLACFLLIPVAAIMAAAPQFVKQTDSDDD